jgi:hypothetical protein
MLELTVKAGSAAGQRMPRVAWQESDARSEGDRRGPEERSRGLGSAATVVCSLSAAADATARPTSIAKPVIAVRAAYAGADAGGASRIAQILSDAGRSVMIVSADIVVLAWSQNLDQRRARAVRAVLRRRQRPALLMPVDGTASA